MKTEGELQQRAAKWARYSNVLMNIGIVAVSVTNLLIDPSIVEKWFSFPQAILIIPLAMLFVFAFLPYKNT